MENEYKQAIADGRELYSRQKDKSILVNSIARDMRAAYNVDSNRVDEDDINKIIPVLRSENIETSELKWVEVTSRRRGVDATCRTRVHAKSGALIIADIFKRFDNNLEINQIRPSELIWQTFV